MTVRRSVVALATAAAAIAVIAACSTGAANPSASPSSLVNANPPPVASAAATPAASASSAAASEAPSESALPSAVATDIDPCELITADDASAFVGVKFGAGKESTADNNVKTCNYDGPGPNLFFVEVAVAPDEATAKAAEAAQEADLESQAQDLASLGLTVTKMPGFAANTDAAIMQGSLSEGGMSVAARAMFLLRGTTFVGFSDTAVGGGEPPSEQAFKDKANELLAKLP